MRLLLVFSDIGVDAMAESRLVSGVVKEDEDDNVEEPPENVPISGEGVR